MINKSTFFVVSNAGLLFLLPEISHGTSQLVIHPYKNNETGLTYCCKTYGGS